MWNQLRIYTVHFKPGETKSVEQLKFVSESFNWYAFVFTILWALYNRLWVFSGIIILLKIVTFVAIWQLALHPLSVYIMQFATQAWIAYHANDFLRASLKRQGFITYALVSGENEMRAEQRFLDEHHDRLPIS